MRGPILSKYIEGHRVPSRNGSRDPLQRADPLLPYFHLIQRGREGFP